MTPASAISEKLQVPDAPAGALIARISEGGTPMTVGNSVELHAAAVGHLFLGVNQAQKSDCSFVVKVQITHFQAVAPEPAQKANVKDQLSSAAKVWLQGQFGKSSPANNSNAVTSNASTGTAAATSSGLKLPTVVLDADLRKNIDGLPRRVHDHLGNPGDMVNFVIVGAEDRAKAALDAANWHLADVDSKKAGLNAIVNTYQKKDYPKTIEYYEKAAKFAPNSDEPYYYIALSKWQNKDAEGAVGAFAKVVVLSKNFAKKAQEYLEQLYKPLHNNTLDGLDQVLAKARAELGISG